MASLMCLVSQYIISGFYFENASVVSWSLSECFVHKGQMRPLFLSFLLRSHLSRLIYYRIDIWKTPWGLIINNHFESHRTFSAMQSGFRAGHGCTSATLKVLNDIITVITIYYCRSALEWLIFDYQWAWFCKERPLLTFLILHTQHDQKYVDTCSKISFQNHGYCYGVGSPFAITASTLLGRLSTWRWNIVAGTFFQSISEVGRLGWLTVGIPIHP